MWKKKLRNDPSLIVETLRPFKKDIEGIVVESTYNWYLQSQHLSKPEGLVDEFYRGRRVLP